MAYAKVEGGSITQFPYSESDLRKDHPNTSFPINALSFENIRSDYSAVEVESSERPEKRGHKSVNSAVEEGGKWVESWELVPKTLEEVEGPDIVRTAPPEERGKRAELVDPEFSDGEWRQVWQLVEISSWLEGRQSEYGMPVSQIEYITENGIEAWQAKVAEIKGRWPKA